MFNGIELFLGVVCSLMGIAVGYVFLVIFFAGLQLISKHQSESIANEDASYSYLENIMDKFTKYFRKQKSLRRPDPQLFEKAE